MGEAGVSSLLNSSDTRVARRSFYGVAPDVSPFPDVQERREVIVWSESVPSFESAHRAAVEKDSFSAFDVIAARLHGSAAQGSAIAGVNVDVFAPQTLRAVIRITVADDGRTAVKTGEIFAATLKPAG